jgi:hypothetical protein
VEFQRTPLKAKIRTFSGQKRNTLFIKTFVSYSIARNFANGKEHAMKTYLGSGSIAPCIL